MIHFAELILALLLPAGQQPAATPDAVAKAQDPREARIQQLISDIARSGRVMTSAGASDRLADPRKQIAPGKPPLLSFRYFEGADRHRFGKLDVMMDDAGH